jgi:hypothetical protein
VAAVLDINGTMPYITLEEEGDLDKLKNLASEISQYDKNYHNPQLLGPVFIDGKWSLIYHAPIPYNTIVNTGFHKFHKVGMDKEAISSNIIEHIMWRIIGLK